MSEIRALPIWVSQWIFFPETFVIMSAYSSCTANSCCGYTVPSLGVRKSERHCMPMLLFSPETVLLPLISIAFNFIESYSLFFFYSYVCFLNFFLKLMVIFLLYSTVWDSVFFFFFLFFNFFLSDLLIFTFFLRLLCWEPIPANNSHGLIRIEYLIMLVTLI